MSRYRSTALALAALIAGACASGGVARADDLSYFEGQVAPT